MNITRMATLLAEILPKDVLEVQKIQGCTKVELNFFHVGGENDILAQMSVEVNTGR